MKIKGTEGNVARYADMLGALGAEPRLRIIRGAQALNRFGSSGIPRVVAPRAKTTLLQIAIHTNTF